jgi:hypothetical protein
MTYRPFRFRFLLAAGSAAILALAGCLSTQPRIQLAAAKPLVAPTAIPDAPAQIDDAWKNPDTWPKRFGRRYGKPNSMGLVETLQGPIVAMRQGSQQKREVEREMLEDIAKLMQARGRGWFRGASSLTIRGEGTGSFVFTRDTAAAPDRVKGPTEPAIYFKYISGTRSEDGEGVRMQRTWFAYYDPVGYGPFDQSPPKDCPGIVVILPGMFGTPGPIVSQTVHALRARGWAVLRMLSHPSRFTEQGTFSVADDADMDAVAHTIAAAMTDRAAECAYAVDEVIAALQEQRPKLIGLPRVAFGMSGGAMVLPTVVARNPDAYSGAVLVAGGADFLRIAMESNYASWIDALRFKAPGGADLCTDTCCRLRNAYRACAPLDSYYTAAALRGKPTLMLHGNVDRAVPAQLGDLLWERAGRPERWSFDVGHELLFMGLPMQMDRIARWLDEHARPPGHTAAPPAAEDWFAQPPGRGGES